MQQLNKTFIQQCTHGNRIAQKALFEQLYAPMLRVCLRYVGNNEDAEDCAMKGFIKAFQHLSNFKYDGEDSLQKWICRIMVNESLMHLRKKKNLVLYTDEQAIEVTLPAEVLLKIEAEELNALIMQLPIGYRAVFNLFAVDGYSHKEIAAILKINENTSKSQFSKAKARLKLLIEQNRQQAYGKLGK
jgi:RNA polymerase sigma factor (sigma-70 family)